MITVKDVVDCVRVANYKGNGVRYKSGLTKGEVYMSSIDCFSLFKNKFMRQIGQMRDMYDLVTMMKDADLLSPAIEQTFSDESIYYGFSEIYVPISAIKKICIKYGIKDLISWLDKVVAEVNEIGIFTNGVKFTTNDKRVCNELNLSDALDKDALCEYARLNDIYEETCYIEIANAISNIVFGDDLHNVRTHYNLYDNDYLCDYITQEEYDEIVFLCKIMSYMLKHCAISIEGMTLFCKLAISSIDRNKYIKNTFDYTDFKRPLERRQEDVRYDSDGEPYGMFDNSLISSTGTYDEVEVYNNLVSSDNEFDYKHALDYLRRNK